MFNKTRNHLTLLSFGRTSQPPQPRGPRFADEITGEVYTITAMTDHYRNVQLVREDGNVFTVNGSDFAKSVRRKHLIHLKGY